MTAQQRARIAAYAQIVAAEGIGPYGHHLTQPGAAWRRDGILPLWMVFYQQRCLEREPVPVMAPARPSGPRRIRRVA